MKSLVARVLVFAPLALPQVSYGQQGVPARMEVEPAALVQNVGDTVRLGPVVYDTADEATPARSDRARGPPTPSAGHPCTPTWVAPSPDGHRLYVP